MRSGEWEKSSKNQPTPHFKSEPLGTLERGNEESPSTSASVLTKDFRNVVSVAPGCKGNTHVFSSPCFCGVEVSAGKSIIFLRKQQQPAQAAIQRPRAIIQK